MIRAAGSLHLYNVDELLDGSRGPVQGGLLFRFQRDLDDLLDAVRAEFDRHAEELPLHAIVPFEIDGAQQYLLFVLQYRLYSNVSRGKRRKAKGEDPLPLEEFGVPEDGQKRQGGVNGKVRDAIQQLVARVLVGGDGTATVETKLDGLLGVQAIIVRWDGKGEGGRIQQSFHSSNGRRWRVTAASM